MMQTLNKPNIGSALDYSFLFSKLEQLSLENSLYRKAFSLIEDAAHKFAGGDLSARISQVDEFNDLSPTLVAINKSYDFTDSFIRESEASQQIALKKQDELRKEQLRELKNYFEQQILPVLR